MTRNLELTIWLTITMLVFAFLAGHHYALVGLLGLLAVR